MKLQNDRIELEINPGVSVFLGIKDPETGLDIRSLYKEWDELPKEEQMTLLLVNLDLEPMLIKGAAKFTGVMSSLLDMFESKYTRQVYCLIDMLEEACPLGKEATNIIY